MMQAGNRKLVWDATGRTTCACDAVNRAQRAPDDPAALHNLGTVQFRRGAWAAAAESYRRSLALRTDSAATWLHLGWALRDSADHPAAHHAWRQALRHDHPAALQALAATHPDDPNGVSDRNH